MKETPQQIWTGEDLSDEEFRLIARLLQKQRAVDLGQYKDRCVRRRIAKRLRVCGVQDLREYVQQLESQPEELDALLATISIHVSQFFRNPDTFRILEATVLPRLCREARQAGRKGLRLWSVGCAGGEEPYSLALLVDELDPGDLEIEILGTDISAPVLQSAREGLYDPLRLKEVPPEVLQTYFREEGGKYRLSPAVRQRVRFERHNIMTAEAYPAADLILCRNVLIYFSRTEQERILTRFAECLSPGGFLVLGRAETLVGDGRKFFQSEYPVERIYRKMAAPPRKPAAA